MSVRVKVLDAARGGAGSDGAVETADIILVRSHPLDVVAIPLAAGALFAWGVLLSPAVGAALMSASTVIVAFNARLLRLKA